MVWTDSEPVSTFRALMSRALDGVIDSKPVSLPSFPLECWFLQMSVNQPKCYLYGTIINHLALDIAFMSVTRWATSSDAPSLR